VKRFFCLAFLIVFAAVAFGQSSEPANWVTNSSRARSVGSGISAPGAPTGLTPSNLATGVSVSQTLQWNSVTNATSYPVYFDAVNGTTLVQNSSATTYSPTLLTSTTYYWKVCASNLAGTTCSSVISFQTASGSSGTGALTWTDLANTYLPGLSVYNPNKAGLTSSQGGDYVIAHGYSPTSIFAYSGGIFDTARNRMVIWGGGHSDYMGNEGYAFTLGALSPPYTNSQAQAWSMVIPQSSAAQLQDAYDCDGTYTGFMGSQLTTLTNDSEQGFAYDGTPVSSLMGCSDSADRRLGVHGRAWMP
jgi:hypothetical protein